MLFEITETLKRYLLATVPDGGDWVVNAVIRQDENGGHVLPDDRLLLFLCAVGENPHLRNRPLQRSGEAYVRPPLGLTLHYIVTYNSIKADECQKRLSQVLQAFHARPRLAAPYLDPSLSDRVDHLQIRLRAMTSEELNQIWTALHVSMRLSLYYEVNAAFIDAGPEPLTAIPPVGERTVSHVNGVT